MKKIIKIEGMHCSGCTTGLEILLNVKSIKAKVDFDSKEAEIEFDPNKKSFEEIKKDIKQIGYEAK